MRTTVATQTVTTLTHIEKMKIVTALSAAFDTDPVFEWLYPNATTRREILPGFFDIFTEAIAPHGASQIAGDGTGATLWIPPREQLVADEDAEAFFHAVNELSPADEERLFACFELMEANHPTKTCWYLNFIGVVPEGQGTGVGSALLRESLARCDRDEMPAYLEATSEANCRLYERFGFAVIGEIALPEGPTMLPMWREPSAP